MQPVRLYQATSLPASLIGVLQGIVHDPFHAHAKPGRIVCHQSYLTR